MMRLLMMVFLSVNLLVSYCFAEQATAEQEEPKLSAEQIFFSSLKEGMVVGYFDQYWLPVPQAITKGYYRKLIKQLGDNKFVVQDFFVDSNNKQSDPVTITNKYELKQYGELRSAEGPYVTWYDNGQKQYALSYLEQGVLDGGIQGWYQNGQLRLKGLYKQGKKTGSWVEWYENGKTKSKTHYANDKLVDSYEQWHDNGQLSVQGHYAKGLLEGLWLSWNSAGQKLSEGSYKANKRIGSWVYYVEGKKWAEGNYKKGLQDGIWIYWNSDGSKDKEIFYQQGKQITKDTAP